MPNLPLLLFALVIQVDFFTVCNRLLQKSKKTFSVGLVVRIIKCRTLVGLPEYVRPQIPSLKSTLYFGFMVVEEFFIVLHHQAFTFFSRRLEMILVLNFAATRIQRSRWWKELLTATNDLIYTNVPLPTSSNAPQSKVIICRRTVFAT